MLNKLDEIEALIERGGEHLEWLKKFIRHPDPNLIPDYAHRGIITENSFDIITTRVRVRIGECASCFRNALNYVACAVADQDSSRISKQVQFPLTDSPKFFKDRRCTYLKGVSDEHVAMFEKFQPYNAGDAFKVLRKLSNWYRHRGLVLVKKKVHQIKILREVGETQTLGPFGRPYASTMNVQSGLAFTVTLDDGRFVTQQLEEIRSCVRAAIDEFKPLIKLP